MIRPMSSRSHPTSTAAFPLIVGVLAIATSAVCAKTAARLPSPPTYRLKVVRAYPHDRQAFTQGLLFYRGSLYESTGLYGRSAIRRVDLMSGQIEHQETLPADLFGEGLARVGERLFQLTWKSHKVLVWDLATLKKVGELAYEGEGWGLCFDGRHLIMSDGSDRLVRRSPDNFAVVSEIRVRMAGRPLAKLNELECTGDLIYANVWQDDHIARIDARTGKVTGWIAASGLLNPSQAAAADVLNGIADLGGTGRLLVTGKLWPRLFEVELVPTSSMEAR
jgi:glutamine cyclotransferase